MLDCCGPQGLQWADRSLLHVCVCVWLLYCVQWQSWLCWARQRQNSTWADHYSRSSSWHLSFSFSVSVFFQTAYSCLTTSSHSVAILPLESFSPVLPLSLFYPLLHIPSCQFTHIYHCLCFSPTTPIPLPPTLYLPFIIVHVLYFRSLSTRQISWFKVVLRISHTFSPSPLNVVLKHTHT